MAEPICVAPTGDWTGEGAVWHAGEGALFWVDINRYLIHRLDPATGNVRSWMFDEPVTATGLTTRDDTLIVAQGSKIILWQPGNHARADFANPHRNWPRERFNDGRPHPAGNFWVGTMQNNVGVGGEDIPVTERAIGRVFRITPDGGSNVAKSGIAISNTFAWSPDKRRFYTGDTLANAISVWDYDARSGDISNERPFFVGFARGLPDGSAVDRDGYLWNARYDGGCVVRVAPDGSVDRVVDLPVPEVTTCTFGGPQLKTLYITTAGGGGAQRKGQRLAGGLFALPVDTPGLPENRFRLAG
jgi:sugar lactone lactonase YvrE